MQAIINFINRGAVIRTANAVNIKMINSKKIFGGILMIAIIVMLVSNASAITKQRAGDVLRAELTRYYDNKQTLLSVQELSDLLTFYLQMPAQGGVNISSSNLSQKTKDMLIIPTTQPNPTSNSNNEISEPNSDLFNGRPNGAWCERDDVCISRNCSDSWNVCSANFYRYSGALKAFKETCSKNEECRTGRCLNKVCVARPCFRDDQCASRQCIEAGWGFGGPYGIDYENIEDGKIKTKRIGYCSTTSSPAGY